MLHNCLILYKNLVYIIYYLAYWCLVKLFSKNNLLISLLSSALNITFLASPGYTMDVPEEGDQKLDQILPSACRASFPTDPFSHEYYDTIITLYNSDNLQEKEMGAAAFRRIAADISHPYNFGAVYNLFGFGTEEDKRAVLPYMRAHSKSLNLTNPLHYNIIKNLFYYGNEDDKRAIMPFLQVHLKDIRNNPFAYKEVYDFSDHLFESNNQEYRELGSSVLREIAQKSTHPMYVNAVFSLLMGHSENREELSETTFLNFFPIFSLEDIEQEYKCTVDAALFYMLNSKYLEIQKQAATLLLDNPLKFMRIPSLAKNICKLFIQDEENKKKLLQKIFERLQFFSSENTKDFNEVNYFNAAVFVLEMSEQEEFVNLAKKVFLNLLEAQANSFIFHAKSLLQSVNDIELREKIVSRLFSLARMSLEYESKGFPNYYQKAL